MLIIDGHNLIPKIPGMSLQDIDDEEKLTALLQVFARVKRKKIVVFFDGAPPGQAGERVYGALRAYFVPARRTADDAILQYLNTMGKAARTATVVTSDRAVQANARELHARVCTSEDFASELSAVQAAAPGQKQAAPGQRQAARAKPSSTDHPKLPQEKVAEWADLFGLDPDHIDRPIEMSKRPAKAKPTGKQKAGPDEPPQSGQKPQKKRRYHGFQKKS